MRWRNFLKALVVGILAVLVSSSRGAEAPATFQFDGALLLKARERFQSDNADAKLAVKNLCKEADEALKLPNYSVMDKPFSPPSGDKHDYMSLAPYWWPDPAKPDGKPYIRKDGEVNSEREKYDQPTLDAMSGGVETLALAYYFTGNEKYAAKAATMIRAWYLDDATKMNPNCIYSQAIKGIDDHHGSGVLELSRNRRVLDAEALLAGSSNWLKEDHQKMVAWVKEFLNYIQTSKQGKNEAKAPNNHGTWYAVQAGTYLIYLGDTSGAKKMIQEQGEGRIATQIEPDGKQPFELVRTKAYDYCRYNLEALLNLAILGDKVGVDLWHYKTADGRCFRAALDWLEPYATGDKKWEAQQIHDPKMIETARVYRIAAIGLSEPKYEEIVKAARARDKLQGGDRVDLVYPFEPTAQAAGSP